MGQLTHRFRSRTDDSHKHDHAGGITKEEGADFKNGITKTVPSRTGGRNAWRTKPLSLIAFIAITFLVLIRLRYHRGGDQFSFRRDRQKFRQHNLFYRNSSNIVVAQRTIWVSNPAAILLSSNARRLNYNSNVGDDEIDYSDMDSRKVFPDDELKVCHPQAAWQTAHYQTCNTLHEIMLLQEHDMHFINCGSSRCTFKIDNAMVLKTVQFHNASFEPYARVAANTDSLALEHLTSSPYVMDIFGSCGIAKVVEYSSQGSLHDVIKESRLREKVKDEVQLHPRGRSWQEGEDRHTIPAEYHRHQYTAPMEKLKIAYQLLVAVADMHGLEQSGGMPLMLHNDLCCHQYVLVDGVYKLGDMDTITFVTVEEFYQRQEGLRAVAPKKSEKVCQTTPLIWDFGSLKAVAPEELIYYDENATRIAVARDKIDVHKIGSTLYTLLTNWWEWEGYHARPVMMKKFQGELPPFPKENTALLSKHDLTALQALREAVLMAWTPNPNERPSARAISNFLLPTIQGRQLHNGDDIVRVSLPPLTPNHRFTDSDFMSRWYTGSDLE